MIISFYIWRKWGLECFINSFNKYILSTTAFRNLEIIGGLNKNAFIGAKAWLEWMQGKNYLEVVTVV